MSRAWRDFIYCHAILWQDMDLSDCKAHISDQRARMPKAAPRSVWKYIERSKRRMTKVNLTQALQPESALLFIAQTCPMLEDLTIPFLDNAAGGLFAPDVGAFRHLRRLSINQALSMASLQHLLRTLPALQELCGVGIPRFDGLRSTSLRILHVYMARQSVQHCTRFRQSYRPMHRDCRY